MKKKAVNLSLEMVIVGIILIIVLVIAIVIFRKGIGRESGVVNDQISVVEFCNNQANRDNPDWNIKCGFIHTTGVFLLPWFMRKKSR